MSHHRPPRLRPLPPEVVGAVADLERGTPDAEVLERLEAALAGLPPSERHAVVAALGYGEDAEVLAKEMGISSHDAELIVRNALQLLRGALADVEVDTREVHGSVTRLQGSAKRHRPGV